MANRPSLITCYGWNKAHFGPPPGIPRGKKQWLDTLSNCAYFKHVQTMSLEERQSLMVSEIERRRMFKGDGRGDKDSMKCAELGLYHLGKHEMQCAFCGCKVVAYFGDRFGHDVEKEITEKHTKSNPNCPFLRGECRDNIPYICGMQCERPEFSLFDTRMKTFGTRFTESCAVSPQTICEAGFYSTNYKDEAECFWCGGKLAKWESKRDPWEDHAKYFPGCAFLRKMKGDEFIREMRERMNPIEIQCTKEMRHNTTDINFLNRSEVFKQYQHYRYLKLLGHSTDLIAKAYQKFDFQDVELSRITSAIGKIKLEPLDELDSRSKKQGKKKVGRLDNFITKQEGAYKKLVYQHNELAMITKAVANLTNDVQDNMSHVKSSPNDEAEARKRRTCLNCKKNQVGAIVLPCDCLCLCKECCNTSCFPLCCPSCGSPTEGFRKV